MLAPLLGATLLVLLSVALVTSWRRSRALVRATDELRESHARHLLQERVTQEKARLEHDRTAFLADVSAVVADSLDAPVALATVARLAVPFVADACVVDLADGEGGLTRVAAVHADPSELGTLTELYRAAAPPHPALAHTLREGKPQQTEIAATGARLAAALLMPLVARRRARSRSRIPRADRGRAHRLDPRSRPRRPSRRRQRAAPPRRHGRRHAEQARGAGAAPGRGGAPRGRRAGLRRRARDRRGA